MFLTVKTYCVCGGCLCRAVTVLNTLYKDQQAAMTSRDCPSGPPTTSSCQSWVRRLHSGFNATSLKKKAHRYQSLYFTGRGFNNLSQVRMGRHIATGQLVAIKQTNLDDCTEEELLQLMVHCCTERMIYSFSWNVPVSQLSHLICVSKPRTKFCFPDCSATRTCWPLAWFSAPAANSGSSPPWWPMVS